LWASGANWRRSEKGEQDGIAQKVQSVFAGDSVDTLGWCRPWARNARRSIRDERCEFSDGLEGDAVVQRDVL
jgi:hypothetical protein